MVGGASTNSRVVTAIVYANGDWDEGDDGGELLIYPDTARREELNAGELARAVEVAPLGGRLVVFDSYLWHEVLPPRKPRYACTLWLTDPAAPRI